AGLAGEHRNAIETFARTGEAAAQPAGLPVLGEAHDCATRAGVGIGPGDGLAGHFVDIGRRDRIADGDLVGVHLARLRWRWGRYAVRDDGAIDLGLLER